QEILADFIQTGLRDGEGIGRLPGVLAVLRSALRRLAEFQGRARLPLQLVGSSLEDRGTYADQFGQAPEPLLPLASGQRTDVVEEVPADQPAEEHRNQDVPMTRHAGARLAESLIDRPVHPEALVKCLAQLTGKGD